MAQIRSKSVADATLATCWKELLASPHPRNERLIHVNTPHLATGIFASEPYQLWEAGKLEASLDALVKIAVSWPYVRNAERARAQGTANFRIMHLPPEEQREPWQNYLVQVLWPYFAATVGETCLVLDRDAYLTRFPDLDHDINRWGSQVRMLTGYTPDRSSVEWREFVRQSDDATRFNELSKLINEIHGFALKHGEIVRPARI